MGQAAGLCLKEALNRGCKKKKKFFNVEAFSLSVLYSCSIDIYATEVHLFFLLLLLLQIRESQNAVTLACSLQMKNRKRLAHDTSDTFATQNGSVHDITDSETHCQTQNGMTHTCIFTTFNR